MNKKLRTLLVALMSVALLTVFQPAMAKGYGMAGCGLGSIIIGPKPGAIQILAATSNATSSNNTSAITTGTSNCSADGVIKAELEQRIYVAQNMQGLEMAISRGNGEKLSSMAYLMGCSINSMDQFSATVKKDYDKIFSVKADGPEFVLHELKKSIAADKTLAQSCKKIWL
jgi:hypothetical protein